MARTARFYSRFTLAVYHAGQLLLNHRLRPDHGAAAQQHLAAQALVYALRHPATWHALRGRAAAALVQLRAVAPEAVAAAEAISDLAQLEEDLCRQLAAWR